MANEYLGGCVTKGSCFTFRGVRYGEYTKILFKDEVYERMNDKPQHLPARAWGYKYPYFRIFRSMASRCGCLEIH